MAKKTAPTAKTKKTSKPHAVHASLVREALEANEGLLRLAPTWVPRSFLMPGRRIKLAPEDIYAYGAHRGGIDERWFASTTPAANENRGRTRGSATSSTAASGPSRCGTPSPSKGRRWSARRSGSKYQRWPVYSKFFDNLGPIPHHMHQNNAQAAKVGQQGKPESYYFPPQLNAVGNNFPYTFFGLEPGTTKDDLVPLPEGLEQGRQRHPQLQQGVSPATGHRLAGAAVRAARPRLAGDL